MNSESLPSAVALIGSAVSRAGFRITTEITYEARGNKRWPYLSVTISSPDGNRVYQSGRYAAWFRVSICWDDENRLWIVSKDIGTQVIAFSENAWRAHHWMRDGNTQQVLDIETNQRLSVVDWDPPSQIKAMVEE